MVLDILLELHKRVGANLLHYERIGLFVFVDEGVEFQGFKMVISILETTTAS